MKKTQIQLSDHFTYQKLLRFVLPSIVMMVFTSIYGVVDGLFVSNFAGKTPFAAINLMMPLTKTRLAGRTLTPMPPVGGALTAELRHKSEKAHRRSRLLRCVGRVVPMCAVLWANRASVRRSTLRKRRVHPPWQCEKQKCARRKIGLAIRLCLW